VSDVRQRAPEGAEDAAITERALTDITHALAVDPSATSTTARQFDTPGAVARRALLQHAADERRRKLMVRPDGEVNGSTA
jgi:hypothetical protein